MPTEGNARRRRVAGVIALSALAAAADLLGRGGSVWVVNSGSGTVTRVEPQ